MIQFGDTAGIAEYKKLWKECFADEDTYIDAFFEALYENKNVLLARENGVLMGASFFLPGRIYCGEAEKREAAERKSAEKKSDEKGDWQEIRYVYALAVYPQFRGRGIAGGLLRRAYQIYDAPLIAEPAEEGLVGGFYEPLGFRPSFYLKKNRIELPKEFQRKLQPQMQTGSRTKQQEKLPQYSLHAAELQPQQSQTGSRFYSNEIQIHSADAEEYCRIRDTRLKKQGYVSWPLCHVAFAVQEHRACGGDALILTGNGREDILLYEISDGQAAVTETTLSEQEVLESAAVWLKEPCTALVAASASEQGESGRDVHAMQNMQIAKKGGEDCLMGMSLGLGDVYGYLNLSLD